jgi:hypothetical protein
MLIFAAAAASQPRILVLPTDLTKSLPLCKRRGAELVDRKADKPVGAQKLNELPNANEYQAVIRLDENGCSKPAIVAYDIGSAPKKQR